MGGYFKQAYNMQSMLVYLKPYQFIYINVNFNIPTYDQIFKIGIFMLLLMYGICLIWVG